LLTRPPPPLPTCPCRPCRPRRPTQALSALKPLQAALPTWRKALGAQVTSDAKAALAAVEYDAYGTPPKAGAPPRPRPQYTDWEDLSWARLALGAGWAPEGGDASEPAGRGAGTGAGVGQDLRCAVQPCLLQLCGAGPLLISSTPPPRNPNPLPPESAVYQELALPRLTAVAAAPGNASVGAAARTGLALLAAAAKAGGAPSSGPPPAYSKEVASIARALQSQLRVQGRTAYVAAGPGSATAAPDEDQALALDFLTRVTPPAGPAAALLQKLSAGVARGRQAGLAALCPSGGGRGAATAGLALAAYDAARGSTSPDVKLTVTAFPPKDEPAGAGTGGGSKDAGAGKVLLSADFSPSSGALTANSTTPWATLPGGGAAGGSLGIAALGRGEASVAAGLAFTPAVLLPFPTYRGLFVERAVQTESGAANLAAAPAGQLVTVTVQVTSPDDLGPVTVEVAMPGGLEPIDPAVYKDPSAALTCSLGGDSFWWWCPKVTVTPSLVTVRYGSFRAGTSSFSFKASAATPGEFTLPPVRAAAVAQPELMGLSAAGAFAVCPAAPPAAATPLVKDPGFGADEEGDAAAAAAAAAGGGAPAARDQAALGPVPAACADPRRPPLAAPKGCPKDCSGNGVCNLAKGACVCNSGFTGADCAQSAVV
jgi:hypothetical protein